ncbi:glycerol-3-phosphate 1-O-acyltransferase PlsY [Roseateles amylovorans]|uniref:Glycerol-3-phosphate acyltransferase n=1 Tax=Roseateles amylovorans TaxID=2978473 RepID=A0ABY6B481_9BURK|nr:glycerol-3-phosphate 1-O-acyltransferase PlsY [Roseateles amylovorans]UXH79652.1 glycerol-3-phosphate 1-O-acyltransferase PlsY [Roseateles amylovorans]
MQAVLYQALAILAGYLIGSLSFAVIISRVMGLSDPRSYGSGNPGATNVLRSGNKAAAILTLLFDALKGYVPVVLVLKFGAPFDMEEGTAAMVGLAAFIGHLWPVFFRFEGGKGVATAAGVLLAINPWLGLSVLLTWIVVAFLSRYSSLASLAAAVCAPLFQMLIWDVGPELLAIGLMSLLLIWRHSANIKKLMAGTESKLGQKASAAAHPAKGDKAAKATSTPSSKKHGNTSSTKPKHHSK